VKDKVKNPVKRSRAGLALKMGRKEPPTTRKIITGEKEISQCERGERRKEKGAIP